MSLEVVHAVPLLDADEGIGPELGERAAVGVDRGAVLDAAFLGVHRRHVGLEILEYLVALAGLGGDDGDDVDHDVLLVSFIPSEARDPSGTGKVPRFARDDNLRYAARPRRSRRPGSLSLAAHASLPSRRMSLP